MDVQYNIPMSITGTPPQTKFGIPSVVAEIRKAENDQSNPTAIGRTIVCNYNLLLYFAKVNARNTLDYLSHGCPLVVDRDDDREFHGFLPLC